MPSIPPKLPIGSAPSIEADVPKRVLIPNVDYNRGIMTATTYLGRTTQAGLFSWFDFLQAGNPLPIFSAKPFFGQTDSLRKNEISRHVTLLHDPLQVPEALWVLFKEALVKMGKSVRLPFVHAEIPDIKSYLSLAENGELKFELLLATASVDASGKIATHIPSDTDPKVLGAKAWVTRMMEAFAEMRAPDTPSLPTELSLFVDRIHRKRVQSGDDGQKIMRELHAVVRGTPAHVPETDKKIEVPRASIFPSFAEIQAQAARKVQNLHEAVESETDKKGALLRSTLTSLEKRLHSSKLSALNSKLPDFGRGESPVSVLQEERWITAYDISSRAFWEAAAKLCEVDVSLFYYWMNRMRFGGDFIPVLESEGTILYIDDVEIREYIATLPPERRQDPFLKALLKALYRHGSDYLKARKRHIEETGDVIRSAIGLLQRDPSDPLAPSRQDLESLSAVTAPILRLEHLYHQTIARAGAERALRDFQKRLEVPAVNFYWEQGDGARIEAFGEAPTMAAYWWHLKKTSGLSDETLAEIVKPQKTSWDQLENSAEGVFKNPNDFLKYCNQHGIDPHLLGVALKNAYGTSYAHRFVLVNGASRSKTRIASVGSSGASPATVTAPSAERSSPRPDKGIKGSLENGMSRGALQYLEPQLQHESPAIQVRAQAAHPLRRNRLRPHRLEGWHRQRLVRAHAQQQTWRTRRFQATARLTRFILPRPSLNFRGMSLMVRR